MPPKIFVNGRQPRTQNLSDTTCNNWRRGSKEHVRWTVKFMLPGYPNCW